MDIFNTVDVFTPTKPATNTFVERNAKISNQLTHSLMTPGKQIVLYGHSGCGKTTLLINKLNETYESYLITRCMVDMTYENVLLDAFDQIGKLIKDTTKSKSFKISPALKLEYQEINASLSLGEYSSQINTTSKTLLPPQLTARRLAEFLGEIKGCWILEDFHKVKGEEKVKISQLMKIFMDESLKYEEVKIIALGAVGTGRQVVEYDKEMNNRVTEIFIPYMSKEEILEIINTGEKQLNLKFSPKVKDKIQKFSCGLASICHQLCLNICFNLKIFKTSKILRAINDDELDEAVEKFVSERSDTLKAEYDRAIKINNGHKKNFPKAILLASLKCGDEFSFDEIKKNTNYVIEDTFILKTLNDLCTSERSELFVFDENSNKYRFNNLISKAYVHIQLKDEVKKTTNSQYSHHDTVLTRLLEIIETEYLKEKNEKQWT